MSRAFVLGGICLLVSFAGCGDSEFPTAYTNGLVLCEGKPLSGAFVYFEPMEMGKDATVGKGAFARTDETGRFVLTTFTSNDGAVVGKHRVRVGGMIKGCKCRLNDNVDLMQVEVKEGEQNDFELVLPLATAAEKRLANQNANDDKD